MSSPGPAGGPGMASRTPLEDVLWLSDRPAGYLVLALSAVEVAVGERVTRRARVEEAQRT